LVWRHGLEDVWDLDDGSALATGRWTTPLPTGRSRRCGSVRPSKARASEAPMAAASVCWRAASIERAAPRLRRPDVGHSVDAISAVGVTVRVLESSEACAVLRRGTRAAPYVECEVGVVRRRGPWASAST
jgi:hypothetical protein